jgi:hypothetical protein
MAQPIYQVYVSRMTEAWYQLTTEEQQKLLATLGEGIAKFGVKQVIHCNSAWASEQYQFFGVNEFPDAETAQKFAAFQAEINWFRYVDGMTTLGTKPE